MYILYLSKRANWCRVCYGRDGAGPCEECQGTTISTELLPAAQHTLIGRPFQFPSSLQIFLDENPKYVRMLTTTNKEWFESELNKELNGATDNGLDTDF